MASSRSKRELSDQPYTRSETTFNADLRSILGLQGLGVLHVRETDTPGAFDLLITWGQKHAWVELKVGDRALEPSQIDFAKKRQQNELLLVARLRDDHAVQVLGYSTGELVWVADYRLFDWGNFLHNRHREEFE